MSIMLLMLAVGLGFLIPGYLVSRLLHCRSLLPASFIVSLLLLFHVVFWLQVLGVPLRFGWLALVLALLALGLAGVCRYRHIRLLPEIPKLALPATAAERMMLGFAVVIAAAFLYRIVMAPLMGPDTPFRWHFLALKMLEHGNFSYYPPVTAADYRIYFYTDAIPPSASIAYFWLYAAFGRVWEPLTAIPVFLQFLGIVVLVFGTARHLANGKSAAGWIAVCVLLSSSLFLWSVAIGQETGLTALAVIGILYFLLTAEAEQQTSAAVLAGAAAALGALSREYGWAFTGCGLAVAVCRRYSWRQCAIFLGTCLVIAFPWYLRTWILTGNPVYSQAVGPLFPVNGVHVEILQVYGDFYRQQGWAAAVGRILPQLALRGLLTILAGVTGFVMLGRRRWDLAICATLLSGLWLWSIPYTASLVISLRVLAPTLVVLAVAAGAGLALRAEVRLLQLATTTIIAVALLFSFVQVITFPADPIGRPVDQWLSLSCSRYRNRPLQNWLALSAAFRPEARILTDNSYIHAALSAAGVNFVPVWSPEVAFIHDPSRSPVEIRKRLRSLGILAVFCDNGGLNVLYLEQQPFYRDDREHWEKVLETPGNYLYFLPPPDPEVLPPH